MKEFQVKRKPRSKPFILKRDYNYTALPPGRRSDGKFYWVIGTNETPPRFLETILKWDDEFDFSLVYNINYAKVWACRTPPYRMAYELEKSRGVTVVFYAADKDAYDHYKLYEQEINGDREMTKEERKQLHEEQVEWMNDWILRK